jgi:hypothetical protein
MGAADGTLPEAGGDDDNENGARPSIRWNDEDGRDNDTRISEETSVTATMIQMCAVLEKRRRDDDEMMTTCADMPGRREQDEECALT